LHRLSTALGVAITEFFQDDAEQTIVFIPADQRMLTERNGLRMESLGIGLRDQQIDPFLLAVEPGAGNTDEPVTHPGQEFVFCISGTVDYYVNDERFPLQPGDSLLFEANQPHYFHNKGSEAAQLLLIFQGERGSRIGRQSHLE
jgi:uncharacterized cupin superfamily protein